MSHTSAIEHLKTLTASDIADLVECSVTNHDARVFIDNVRDRLVEELDARNGQDLESEQFDEVVRELADGAPDAWTATRLAEAVGTGCHQVSSDFTTPETTMVELAGYVLYEQAREIQTKLIELYNEELLVASEPTA